MTKQQIIDLLNSYGLSKSDAAHAWENIVVDAKNELIAMGASTLPGLGTLHVRTRAARPERPGRNMHTGEALVVPAQPAKKVVVLSAVKALKDAINS